nr:MAG TPA: YsxB-like protein [Caudoviricetes sp.]
MITARLGDRAGLLTLEMDGHAGSAPAGQDLVCAAASILCYTLAARAGTLYSDGKLRSKPVIELDSGHAAIAMRPRGLAERETRAVWDTVGTGLRLLQREYPDYIRVDSGDYPR